MKGVYCQNNFVWKFNRKFIKLGLSQNYIGKDRAITILTAFYIFKNWLNVKINIITFVYINLKSLSNYYYK